MCTSRISRICKITRRRVSAILSFRHRHRTRAGDAIMVARLPSFLALLVLLHHFTLRGDASSDDGLLLGCEGALVQLLEDIRGPAEDAGSLSEWPRIASLCQGGKQCAGEQRLVARSQHSRREGLTSSSGWSSAPRRTSQTETCQQRQPRPFFTCCLSLAGQACGVRIRCRRWRPVTALPFWFVCRCKISRAFAVLFFHGHADGRRGADDKAA